MSFYPGDVVLIKHIVFENGSMDHCSQGRPCIVLYTEKTNSESNREKVFFLSITSNLIQLKKSSRRNQYIDAKCLKADSLINISSIYATDSNNIAKPFRNVGKDIFRVVDSFLEFHNPKQQYDHEDYLKYIEEFCKGYDIKKVIDILSIMKQESKNLEVELSNRKAEIKEQTPPHQPIYNNHISNIPEDKKWETRKSNEYKKLKERSKVKSMVQDQTLAYSMDY